MATIQIKRTSEFVNGLRSYQLYLDGQRIGIIAKGKTIEFPVSPGHHKLVAKIDWCSSPEISFDIDDDQTRVFKVGGFKSGSWIMPASLGLIFLHFILKYTFQFVYTIFLVIPAFLFFVYYVTLGRKNYLTLSEI